MTSPAIADTASRKPVILTVDDDPGVSRAVARDLRRHYGQAHRIVRAESGPDALETPEYKALGANNSERSRRIHSTWTGFVRNVYSEIPTPYSPTTPSGVTAAV